jgi:long-subunit fatty acid transport protein
MTKTMLHIALMLLCGAHSLISQSKTGTSIGAFLLIEPSARIAGMGNAGVTNYSEIQSAYYNPAAIGQLTGSGVQVTHSPWLVGITYDYAAAAVTMGDAGNIYAALTSLNSGEIAVRTVAQPLGTGERYTVSDIAVSLGYGRRISEKFSVGLQLTYLQETIWNSSMSAAAISVGTLYRISPTGLHIGASISNFGTRGKYDGRDMRIQYDQDPTKYGDNGAIPAELFTDTFPLPVLFRVGLGLPVVIDDNNKITLAADAFHPSDNTESVSIGGEYSFMDMFAVRAGWQNLFLQDSEVGLTFGAGLQYQLAEFRLSVDYGWADYGRLNKVNRFTVGFLF